MDSHNAISTFSLPQAQPVRAHLIGIGGAGMKALAGVLQQRGWLVSGSDMRADAALELLPLKIPVAIGHAAENLPRGSTLVVYSSAIAECNPERQHARDLGIPERSYPQMLAELASGTRLLAVAGTHGKSTVTAMAGEILTRARMNPTVIYGASPIDGQASGQLTSSGQSKLTLVEACEYRENFLLLRPETIALLNIEPDHFDYYCSPSQLHGAFAKFVDRTPADGFVIASTQCKTALNVALSSGRRVVTFGLLCDADWQAAHLEQTRGRYRFDLVHRGQRLARVRLSVAGMHNVLNALAAAALTRRCDATIDQIAHGLSAFRGLKRRLQARWTLSGVTWVDDYAHHPSEVRGSLAALREMFAGRRIVCVFQPHQASRLACLLDEFAHSLHNADCVAVADVVRAREGVAQPGEPTAADLAAKLRKMGVHTLDEHRPENIANRLADELEPGDVLVTMGAGDLDKYFHNFHQRLRRDHAPA